MPKIAHGEKPKMPGPQVQEQPNRGETGAEFIRRTATVLGAEKTACTIFETSYMNQGLLTRDGKVVYANGTSLASINGRLEDVIGRDFADTPWFAGTPGMSETVRNSIARAAEGESIQMTMPLDLPTGRRVYDFSMRPAMDEAGNVTALVQEAIEITARVRAEEALHHLMKIEALGRLTGGIAHDFNSILAIILSNLELLRKKLPPAKEFRRLIDRGIDGTRRGRSLTARLLAFARKQELKLDHVNMNELVKGIAELLDRSLGQAVALDISIDADNPWVVASLDQLECALLNLVANAHDAMPNGGTITVSVSTFTVEGVNSSLKPGKYACLAVTDTGMGMDETTLRLAAEPFFTKKDVGKGTGLGLSMVHDIAVKYGGQLILGSEKGTGTIAEIFLPVADAFPSLEPGVLAALNENMVDTRVLTVLVVDDDPLIRLSSVALLEELGHIAISATSGRQALKKLGRRTFDVLLTDHAMPRMTGTELAAEVRRIHPEIGVILTTGYEDLPIGEKSDLLTMQKPFSRQDLVRALSTVE